jgi:hypothetical protein
MIIGLDGRPCYYVTETCPIEYAYWGYRPSFSTNITFTALFGISTIAFLVQGIAGKKWLGFTIAMVSGCALEVIGYVGRILAHKDMFSEVCLRLCDHQVTKKLVFFPSRTSHAKSTMKVYAVSYIVMCKGKIHRIPLEHFTELKYTL